MKAQVNATTLKWGIDVATLRRLEKRNNKIDVDLEVDMHPSSKTVLASCGKRHALIATPISESDGRSLGAQWQQAGKTTEHHWPNRRKWIGIYHVALRSVHSEDLFVSRTSHFLDAKTGLDIIGRSIQDSLLSEGI